MTMKYKHKTVHKQPNILYIVYICCDVAQIEETQSQILKIAYNNAQIL